MMAKAGISIGPQPTVMAPLLAPWPAMIALRSHLNKRVVAQKHAAHALVIAMLADGHVLLEGSHGLAKTRVATALARSVEATFQRVLFSPGTQPSDIIGTIEDTGALTGSGNSYGPTFANILLAEGIEHASPETRLALFDAMTERYVVGKDGTTDLPGVFFVCATHTSPVQNRGEQMLSPAELDRFLMHLRMEYPDEAAERRILRMARTESCQSERLRLSTTIPVSLTVVLAARNKVREIKLGPKMQRYIAALVAATRPVCPQPNDLRRWIAVGAGPRAGIALERCARANAWLAGRRQVTVRDAATVAHGVLRHRIQLFEAAEKAGVTVDPVIDELLAVVADR